MKTWCHKHLKIPAAQKSIFCYTESSVIFGYFSKNNNFFSFPLVFMGTDSSVLRVECKQIARGRISSLKENTSVCISEVTFCKGGDEVLKGGGCIRKLICFSLGCSFTWRAETSETWVHQRKYAVLSETWRVKPLLKLCRVNWAYMFSCL